MKHYSKKVAIKSDLPRDYFAITQQVSFVVAESEIKDGLVLCYSNSNKSILRKKEKAQSRTSRHYHKTTFLFLNVDLYSIRLYIPQS